MLPSTVQGSDRNWVKGNLVCLSVHRQMALAIWMFKSMSVLGGLLSRVKMDKIWCSGTCRGAYTCNSQSLHP